MGTPPFCSAYADRAGNGSPGQSALLSLGASLLADASVSEELLAGSAFDSALDSALDSEADSDLDSLLESDSDFDSDLDSLSEVLLDSDALDAELEECSELLLVLWELLELEELELLPEELEELDSVFSCELLDVLPEDELPEEELDELLEAASPVTVRVSVLLVTLQSL